MKVRAFRLYNIAKFGAGAQTRSVSEAIADHDNNYTLIRAFLAASVIYFHAFALSKAAGHTDHLTVWLHPRTSVGGLAVQSFFFLSGLFVAQSFYRDQNLLNFLVRRVLRICPGLFICLVVTSVLAAVLSFPGQMSRIFLFSQLYDYILSNAWFRLDWNISGVFADHRYTVINGAIHTLPLEVKMYAVLAFLGLCQLLSRSWAITAAGLVVLILIYIPGFLGLLPFNLFDAAYSRTAGAMFLAGVVVFGASHWIRPSLFQGVVLLLIYLLTTHGPRDVSFFAIVIWVLLYLGQFTGPFKIWRPKNDLSYGIYIYGWPSEQFVLSVTHNDLNPYLLMVLGLFVASVFAFFSWRLVERPAIKFGNKVAGLNLRHPASWRDAVLGVVSRQFAPVGATLGILVVCLAMGWLTSNFAFVPVVPMPARIVDFSPKSSVAGLPINPQPDGNFAIWVKLSAQPAAGTEVVFEGQRITTWISRHVITAAFAPGLVRDPGDKVFFLEARLIDRIERSAPEVLQITAKPAG